MFLEQPFSDFKVSLIHVKTCVHFVLFLSNKVIKNKLTLGCFSLLLLINRTIVAAGPEYSGELRQRDDSF